VAPGETELLGLDGEADRVEAAARAWAFLTTRSVLLPVLEHLERRDEERRQRIEVVVAAGAGNAPCQSHATPPSHVAQDDAALRAGEGLMRAGGEHLRPFWRDSGIACGDEAEDMGAIVYDMRADLLADLDHLRYRFREEEEALAEDDQLGLGGFDKVARSATSRW